MKQIEAFVDEVYHNFGRNKKEIEELKAEMKNHLLEAVHELKSEGKSDQEAIDIAIERFGGEKEMRSIVGQLFKVQKLFARRVLYTSLAAIMLPTLLFLYFYVSEKDYNMEINETSGYILQILGDKKSITEETQKRIEDVLKQKNFFLEIEIFESKKLFSAGPEPAPSFQFENNLNFIDKFLHKYHLEGGHSHGNENWYMKMDVKSYDELLSNVVLPIGIVVYWVLFAIWAIINSYHQRRLNVGWIISFSLFNALGYLIYVLVGKRKVTAS